MATALEIASCLDTLLETASTPDYAGAINGLQLENRGVISCVASAVDFSKRAIDGAIANKANLILVHHGMFWGGTAPFRGPAYRRLRQLLENDIAVYSSHLPLDRHSVFGNNVLLAKELSLEPSAPFARYQNIFIGVSGESDIETASIVARAQDFAASHSGAIRTTGVSPKRKTRRWAVCTGAGASAETLQEAEELQIDTLIVGEGPHWTAVQAEEQGLAIIYAGHYATETLGVRAVARHVAEQFHIRECFISAPTGL